MNSANQLSTSKHGRSGSQRYGTRVMPTVNGFLTAYGSKCAFTKSAEL